MSQDARQDEELATLRRSRLLGLPYIDTTKIANKQLYHDLLSVAELYQMKIIPIMADTHHINFGITNTTSQQTMAALRQRFQDQQLTFSLISDIGYRDYMKLYDPPKEVIYHDIALNQAAATDLVQTVSATLEQVRADDMLAYLVQQAHRLDASDIHMENQRDFIRIRFRIDGVLHPVARLSQAKYHVLVSAVASAGNISTASTDAQQGHIAMHTQMADGQTVDVNVRLETMPTVSGMDMVMRLFNMDQSMFKLERLGLSPAERRVVDDIISRPSGLVLAVGPTGSGKTTTLYSILNSLNSEEHKLITIEDPVEYQFEGITQISVTTETAGETSFADKLRAVLRLDPDIVMIGEIRDTDTAKTALQAALTGHLVLSTLHAGSAAAALTRLMDVIGTNPLFVSAIRLIMAQRLVRLLDDKTKQPFTPDDQTQAKIHEILESLPPTTAKPDLTQLQLFKPGKSADNPFGFDGQLAIREQFLMSGEIRQLLEHPDKVLSAQDIEASAIASGMKTMLQDGILKVCAGLTTLDEVLRVVG
ncbi:Flp pilus assembly complex ATPase component TadA [Candidatus Saccharibacteria bacterium]|nr:Flp pilus assembly complex ATPase component TadA [Candidatus Saccharibacteria bacterium]